MTDPTATNPHAALDALRASGSPITLATGEVVRIRYSMDSLDRLEREFGNIGNILTQMRDAEQALSDSMNVAAGTATDEQRARYEQARAGGSTQASIFGLIAKAILPGLADAQATHPRTGAPFYLEDDERAARQLLDAAYLRDYVEAFTAAFTQAFYTGDREDPQVPTAAETTADPTPQPSTDLSTGTDGGTSRPSWATAPMPSSGA